MRKGASKNVATPGFHTAAHPIASAADGKKSGKLQSNQTAKSKDNKKPGGSPPKRPDGNLPKGPPPKKLDTVGGITRVNSPGYRVSKTKTVRSGKPKGLHNPKNGCYMNSILQCLLHQQAYCEMLEDIHQDCDNEKSYVPCSLKDMYEVYWDPKCRKSILTEPGQKFQAALAARLKKDDKLGIGQDIHQKRQSCPYDLLQLGILDMLQKDREGQATIDAIRVNDVFGLVI